MATAFAWSNITLREIADGTVNEKIIPVGSQVSQKSLGVDDENWDAMLSGGAIRYQPYPKTPDGYTDSPNRYFTDLLSRFAQSQIGDPLEEHELEFLRMAAGAGITGDEETNRTSGNSGEEPAMEIDPDTGEVREAPVQTANDNQ